MKWCYRFRISSPKCKYRTVRYENIFFCPATVHAKLPLRHYKVLDRKINPFNMAHNFEFEFGIAVYLNWQNTILPIALYPYTHPPPPPPTKIIGKSCQELPKDVIHGNECIILFLTCYFTSWNMQFRWNNYRSLISPLSLRTVFSYLALWRHHSWSVTSRERGALALWRHSPIVLARANWR